MSELISEAYRGQQVALHADPRGYGRRGSKWAPTVARLAGELGAASILDYGCGQGTLARALAADFGLQAREYDPAIAGKDGAPVPADLVVCTDVLEHVEEDRIDAVLDHLAALSGKALFAVISTVEAGKTLPDGRNAHILIRPASWWSEQLFLRFETGAPVTDRPQKAHKEFAAVWRRSW